jgi:hypothetical protein
LNTAINQLLAKLNDRKMRHVKQSRRELYERIDRPALKTLPAQAYEFADWKQVGVNIDYHIAFDEHFYSVPYTLVGESMWCRATGRTIELIHQGKRITTHLRSFVKYDYSTHPEHRAASHRAYLECWPQATPASRGTREAREQRSALIGENDGLGPREKASPPFCCVWDFVRDERKPRRRRRRGKAVSTRSATVMPRKP